MFQKLINKEESIPTTDYNVSVDVKKKMTDAFVISNSFDEFLINCSIHNAFGENSPSDWINYATTSYHKKIAINEKVTEIMQGQCVKGETEEGVEYYPVPTTKTALVSIAYSFFPDCSKESFEYNISKIIAWADGTGECTTTKFFNYFKQ